MPSLIDKSIAQRTRKSHLISLSAQELLANAHVQSTELETLLDIAHELTHRSTNAAASTLTEVKALISSLLSAPTPGSRKTSDLPARADNETLESLAAARRRIAELEKRSVTEHRKHSENLKKQITKLNVAYEKQLSLTKTKWRRKLKAAEKRFGEWREQFKVDFQEKLIKDRELDTQRIRELEKSIEELETFYEPKNPTKEEAALSEAYQKVRQRNLDAAELLRKREHQEKTNERHRRECSCYGEVPNCDWCSGRGFYHVDGFGNVVT